jgi:pilus assembly protein CpaB
MRSFWNRHNQEGHITMRRGGRLLLLVGILIAAAAAGLLFFYLNSLGGGGIGGVQPGQVTSLPTEEPEVEIVIAAVDIPSGRLITETALLSTQLIPASEYNANRNQYLTNISEAVNKLTVNPVSNGQPVFRRDLTDAGLSQQMPPADEGRPRDKALAVSVDALAGVADQIKERDFVDIVATFIVQRRVSLPGPITDQQIGGQTVPTESRTFELVDALSTKTLVQRAQVIKIVRPPVPQEGQEGAPPAEQPAPAPDATPAVDASGQPIQQAPPAQGNTITQGSWLLVLLVNDQEAEMIDFARNANANISLVLRGAGDTDFEPTIGASLDLLISEFGVPLPEPLPAYSYGRDALDPVPTRTPAPTRVP